MTEAATATNPTEANAPTEESAAASTPVETKTDGEQQPNAAETQSTTETKTDGDKPAGETKTETAAEGAPEKYEFKAPDGTEYDAQLLDSFTAAAKEANLTQDAAQKLIEKMAPAIAARQNEQIQAIHKGWIEASSADTEFGGEKLKENLGVARKALDTFGTPELRSLLENSGLGNHPEVLRFMYRAGKAISEDTFVGGKPSLGGAANPAAVLYDNTKTA